MKDGLNFRPLIAAGTLMGIGLGGFVDGILFHQILQFHNMVSGKFPETSLANVQVGMFWDGMFHVVTWIATAIAVFMLWKAARRRDVPWCGRAYFGATILGWGLFNLVEGVIDHHILHLHHVVERLGVSVYDYLFLASGVLFITIGWAMIHRAQRRLQSEGPDEHESHLGSAYGRG